MSDVWGNQLKLSIFGESHGPAIGVVIDGLPAGITIDEEQIVREMKRRAPGQNAMATARKEADRVEIQSGLYEGKTTGNALCGLIRNSDTRSRDYEDMKRYFRPGHADYSGKIRYAGYNDIRGGGHFSGRLTAPFLFAGAVCKQLLASKNICIYGRAKSIGIVSDFPVNFADISGEQWQNAPFHSIPTISEEKAKEMEAVILEAKEDTDSVGGIAEIISFGVQAGLGNPFFDSLESEIAHLAFSVPAVKGIEFGDGFSLSSMRGSVANDSPIMEGTEIFTKTNHNGGILGGISTGMPIVFRTALKPTPSIGKLQETVDLAKNENATFVVKGRHDPCVVVRAVPVLEAVAALAITDALLIAEGNQWKD